MSVAVAVASLPMLSQSRRSMVASRTAVSRISRFVLSPSARVRREDRPCTRGGWASNPSHRGGWLRRVLRRHRRLRHAALPSNNRRANPLRFWMGNRNAILTPRPTRLREHEAVVASLGVIRGDSGKRAYFCA